MVLVFRQIIGVVLVDSTLKQSVWATINRKTYLFVRPGNMLDDLSHSCELEHFPTNLTHPDRVRRSAGQEWRAAGAGCPCKRRDEASGPPDATPQGRADWGAGLR